VGRKNKQAFCYLISPSMEKLNKNSFNRLIAIEKFSGLGDGFNIAMKDLEIRGAGDVLGAEQSGFINDVGFHTYQKILTEATEELKHEEFNQKNIFKINSNCSFDTDLELIIPDNYIENRDERLYIYTQLSNVHNNHDLNKIKYELKDRFGKIPLELINLIDSIKLKWKGETLGFKKIILKNEKMIIFFPNKKNSAFYNSNAFLKILEKIKSDPTFCYLKEKNEQLNLYVNKKVNSIKNATEIIKIFEQ
jgi:transcription-repair coupling factor (superfamily II helicase)